MWDIETLQATIEASIKSWPLGDKLSLGLVALCEVVVAFYFIRFFVMSIYRGGEPFHWQDLGKPVFYMICIAGWSYIFEFINIAINGIVEYAYSNSGSVGESNEKVANALQTFSNTVESAKTEQGILEDIEDGDWWDKLLRSVNLFDDKLLMEIGSWAYYIAGGIDTLLYYVFYMVAEIWKKILAMSGPIAFTVSLFSGGWTVLINWAKNLLAVSLWLPFAALIMALVDSIMLDLIQATSKPLLSSITGAAPEESFSPLFITEALQGLVKMLLLVIGFLVIKVIFLSKVPAMISSIVTGGNSDGGGFAAAFIPFGIAVSAAKTGVGAATGGASMAAGAAASGVKKGFKK